MFSTLKTEKHPIDRCLIVLIGLTAVTFPLSVALKNIFIFATLGLCLFSPKVRAQLKPALQFHFTRWHLALFALISIGTLYSFAEPLSLAAQGILKYRKLLYPVLLLPLFLSSKTARSAFIWGLTAGCTLAILYIIAVSLPLSIHDGKIPFNKGFINPIFMSSMVAILAYYHLSLALNKQLSLLSWSLTAFFTIYIFIINGQKTGLILYLPLMLLAILFHAKRKLPVLITFGALCTLFLFALPTNLSHRLSTEAKQVNRDHAATLQEKKDSTHGSVDTRIYLIQESFALFKERPIYGWGTWSHNSLFMARGLPFMYGDVPDGKNSFAHPHNQFMLVLVEWGIIGLFVFGMTLLAPILDAHKQRLPQSSKRFAWALLVAFILACGTDTALQTAIMGEFYLALMTVILASRSA